MSSSPDGSKRSKRKSKNATSTGQFTGMTSGFMVNDDADIIRSTCKQITHIQPPKKKQRNFVKRMEFDVCKRESRERTFDSLKNSITHQMQLTSR